MVVVVRNRAGRITSVVSGGRQVTVGSRAYNELPSSVRREVEARSSGRATVIQSEGGTSVYAGEPGQTSATPIVKTPEKIVKKGQRLESIQKSNEEVAFYLSQQQSQQSSEVVSDASSTSLASPTPSPSGFQRLAETPQFSARTPTTSSGILVGGYDYAPEARTKVRNTTEPYISSSSNVPFKDLSAEDSSKVIDIFKKEEVEYYPLVSEIDKKLEALKERDKNEYPSFRTSEYFWASAASGIIKPGVFLGESLANPKQTGKLLSQTAVYAYKTPLTFTESVIGETITSFKKNPTQFTFEIIGGVGVQKAGTETLQIGRNIYISTKAKGGFVKPEDVFEVAVLEGKQTFPLKSSTPEAIQSFKSASTPEGTLIGTSVTDVSPAFSGKEIKIKAGPAALAGKEDTGLYITPGGRGSAYFTKLLGGEETTYSLSLNPFAGVKKPGVVNVEYSDIIEIPGSIKNKPGYRLVQEFERSKAGSGEAIITKRSEVSTSEIEAVIPEGAVIKKKTVADFDKYTRLEGVNIPIREFEYLQGSFKKAVVNVGDGVSVSSGSSSGLKRVAITPYPITSVLKYSRPSSESSASLRRSSGGSLKRSSSSGASGSSSLVSGSSFVNPSSTVSIRKDSSAVSPSKYTSTTNGSSSSSSLINGSSIVSPPVRRVPRGSSYSSINRKSTSVYPPYAPPKKPTYATSEYAGKEELFDLFVRRRGSFGLRGARLSRAQAETQAGIELRGSAAASAKIVKSGSGAKGSGYFSNIGREFRPSKRDSDVIVQKSKYRISSPGEKAEITYKGITASRLKNRR